MTPLAPPFGHPRSGRKGMVPRLPILGTITDLVATAGDGAAVLTFTAPVGAHGYLPQFRTTAGPGAWMDAGDPNDLDPYPGAAGFQVTGLTNGTGYDFRVLAHDDFTSTTSNTDSATPTLGGGFGTVNDLIEDSKTDTTMTVEFTQVSDDLGDPAKYAIRYRENSIDENTWGEAFGTEEFIDTSLAIGVLKQHQFTGLVAGTTYGVMLIPFRGTPGSADAFGDFSNAITITTTGTSQLGTIADLSAIAGDTEVSLSWTPAVNATSHQPRVNDGGGYSDFGSPLGGGADSVTVTGLTNDVSHDFIVRAGDGVTTTDSNEVSATPSTVDHPNQPAGMTPFTDKPHDALEEEGWSVHNSNGLSIVADATAPISPSNVAQHEIQGGQSAGVYGNLGPGFIGNKDIYLHFAMKLSSNWQGHSSGTSPKVFNLKAGSGNNHILRVQGNDAGPLDIAFNAQINGRTPVAEPLTCSSNNDLGNTCGGAAEIVRGQWHEIEMYAIAGTKGNADGEVHVWVDGQKALEKVGYQLLGTDGNSSFSNLNQLMLWGGTGDEADNTMQMWIDHVYMSVKN